MAKKNSIEWRLDRLERLLGYMQIKMETVYHRTYARTKRRDDIERRVINQAQALVKRLKDSRFLLAKKGQRGVMYLTPAEQQKVRQLIGRDKRRLTKKQRVPLAARFSQEAGLSCAGPVDPGFEPVA